MSQEQERLVAIQIAVTQMTNTPGYFYLRKIADNVVDSAKNKILDCKTSAEREEAALRAAALRDGFAELFQALEAARFVGSDADLDLFADLDPFAFEPQQ